MKIIVITLVALIMGTAPADANRPVPGRHYKDQCYNIPGKQPIYELYGTGPYRFTLKTPRPHDCHKR